MLAPHKPLPTILVVFQVYKQHVCDVVSTTATTAQSWVNKPKVSLTSEQTRLCFMTVRCINWKRWPPNSTVALYTAYFCIFCGNGQKKFSFPFHVSRWCDLYWRASSTTTLFLCQSRQVSFSLNNAISDRTQLLWWRKRFESPTKSWSANLSGIVI